MDGKDLAILQIFVYLSHVDLLTEIYRKRENRFETQCSNSICVLKDFFFFFEHHVLLNSLLCSVITLMTMHSFKLKLDVKNKAKGIILQCRDNLMQYQNREFLPLVNYPYSLLITLNRWLQKSLMITAVFGGGLLHSCIVTTLNFCSGLLQG